jgi:hypothetical protein
MIDDERKLVVFTRRSDPSGERILAVFNTGDSVASVKRSGLVDVPDSRWTDLVSGHPLEVEAVEIPARWFRLFVHP